LPGDGREWNQSIDCGSPSCLSVEARIFPISLIRAGDP